VRKHQYVDTYIDPDLNERIKAASKKLLISQIEHIEGLSEDKMQNPHEDKLQGEVRSSGIKWLEAYAAKERALAARARRMGEEIRLLGDLKNLLTTAPVQEQPEEEPTEKPNIEELLKQAQANLPKEDKPE
jgi:fatty-acid desaturase